MSKVTLKLSDGTSFIGTSIGYEKNVTGEIVFNTTMIGYPESLTDPSSKGQIMVMTYPLIGNYGVPEKKITEGDLSVYLESNAIHPAAIIMTDYSPQYSHWNAHESLSDWLIREQIPAITGIDTRALTKHLREHGVMEGTIVFDNPKEDTTIDTSLSLVEQVSCKEIINYNPSSAKKVVLVDCGVKHSLLRYLISRDIEIIRVPWDYDFNTLSFDALFISNGPGDPRACSATIDHLRTFMVQDQIRPLMGVGLGNQLIALAAGAQVEKLKVGHRGATQPVQQIGSQRCFITAQNHGYAVLDDTLPTEWKPTFVNMNDGTNEGIAHISKPWSSVQFVPEMNGTMVDSEMVFDHFFQLLNNK